MHMYSVALGGRACLANTVPHKATPLSPSPPPNVFWLLESNYILLRWHFLFTDSGWLCFCGGLWWQNHVYIWDRFCPPRFVSGRCCRFCGSIETVNVKLWQFPQPEMTLFKVCFYVWAQSIIVTPHGHYYMGAPLMTFMSLLSFCFELMSVCLNCGQPCSEILPDFLTCHLAMWGGTKESVPLPQGTLLRSRSLSACDIRCGCGPKGNLFNWVLCDMRTGGTEGKGPTQGLFLWNSGSFFLSSFQVSDCFSGAFYRDSDRKSQPAHHYCARSWFLQNFPRVPFLRGRRWAQLAGLQRVC